MGMYENTTVMNYLKKPTTRKSTTTTPYQPKEFPDKVKLSMEEERRKYHRPFPRWGQSMEEEERNGIDIQRLMNFIMNSSSAAHAPGVQDLRYISTSDHGNDVGRWYPEILYVLDHNGIHVSDRHRNIVLKHGNWTVRDKFIPVELKMLDAYHLLWKDTKYSFEKWPLLSKAVLKTPTDASLSSSGFPFLMWHGDYTGCNFLNWKGQYSIPIYTVAALDACNYTFPFPNYGNAIDANVPWDNEIKLSNMRYPWKDKLSQIVWRGGLTGAMADIEHKCPRWKMMEQIHAMEEEYMFNASLSDSPMRPFLFDFGATRLPSKHKKYIPYMDEVGGFVKSMPMEDFQLYRGILDMDGNSWSMRFGRLLCFNSVVLKVEPTWVEYFYHKDSWFRGEPKLQPWVHYIPVKADLSDLVELSEFVVDPANDEFLQNMVSSATAWCQRNMVKRQIGIDMLNIWERYLQLISVNNPNWIEELWIPLKEEIFHPSSPFEMSDSSIGMVYE
jgi:hypothetical protein